MTELDHAATLDALDTGYRRVTDVVTGLSEAELMLPSGCAGWAVTDVLYHQLLDAQRALVAFATPVTGPAGETSGCHTYSPGLNCGVNGATNWPWVKPAAKASQPADQAEVRLYTLEVFIISGPVSEKFAKKNPVVSRTIQMRGDQTLEDLHRAIFDAYDRWEEHMYEFQFGKGPMDPKARRYVLPNALEIQKAQPNPPLGRVDQTTVDSLDLKVGDRFGYWFDFGDDWWHQINVEAVEDKVPRGKLPKVTKKVGKSPPQYADD